MEFSRQDYWSRLPCPPPGDLPNPGTEPRSPALQTDSLLSEPTVLKTIKIMLVRPPLTNFKMTVRAECAPSACSPLPLPIESLAHWLAGGWGNGLWTGVHLPHWLPASKIKQMRTYSLQLQWICFWVDLVWQRREQSYIDSINAPAILLRKMPICFLLFIISVYVLARVRFGCKWLKK